MHNVHLVGIHHMDHFSLRGCFLVIGAFGVVTIISYINELAKAGLLSGNPKFKLRHGIDTFRRNIDEVQGFRPGEEDDNVVILHKNGDFHHLNVDLLPLNLSDGDDGDYVGDNMENTEKPNTDEEEIQIALHLQKKNKYAQAKNSSTKIYQFHQVLPNFYLSINESLQEVITDTVSFSEKRSLVNNFTRTVLGPKLSYYRNHSKVLVYQHDPNGYAIRDCLLSLAVENKKFVAGTPLNAIYRKNWEKMDRRQRDKYDILYGGLSFGVCEGLSNECSYFLMIMHPLDRLLQTYWFCTNKTNASFCQFLRTENITNIYSFVERYASAFFHKLLYYSRHCRLIGNHEMCIHDDNIYFVLSPEEKARYLDDILQNLERWFSVIGIAEDLSMSLNLISGVTGLNFMKCLASEWVVPKLFYKFFHKFHDFRSITNHPVSAMTIDGMSYSTARQILLNDAKVSYWMSADLKIYERLVEIFHKQVSVYNSMKQLMMIYYSPTLDNHRSNRSRVSEVNVTVTSKAVMQPTTVHLHYDQVKYNNTTDKYEMTMNISTTIAPINTSSNVSESTKYFSSASRSSAQPLLSTSLRKSLTGYWKTNRQNRKNG